MDSEPGKGPPGIGRDLELVAAGLAGLRELASDPRKAEDDARIYDFRIKWGVLISGRLKRLEHYHRAGELTQGQERRYRDLKRELRAATPEAERLGLARPGISPED